MSRLDRHACPCVGRRPTEVARTVADRIETVIPLCLLFGTRPDANRPCANDGDNDDEDGGDPCLWSWLPVELWRGILVRLHPASLAALLLAGPSRLVRIAASLEPDLVRDALWWHFWNLPDNAWLGSVIDGAECFDGACTLPPCGRRWHIARCRSRAGIGDRPARWSMLAVDMSHPVRVWTQPDGVRTPFVADADGAAVIALSCLRLCTADTCRALVDLGSRCQARDRKQDRLLMAPEPECLVDTRGRRRHGHYNLIANHIVIQSMYLGRSEIGVSYLCDVSGDESSGVDVVSCTEHAARLLATGADSQCMPVIEVLTSPAWPPDPGLQEYTHTPLVSWLPAACDAVEPDRIVDMGLYAFFRQWAHAKLPALWVRLSDAARLLCIEHVPATDTDAAGPILKLLVDPIESVGFQFSIKHAIDLITKRGTRAVVGSAVIQRLAAIASLLGADPALVREAYRECCGL